MRGSARMMLGWNTTHRRQYDEITRYMGSSMSKGVLLLVLCLFTWLNNVIADASGALQMISAV